jgi:hypothetical protein
MSTIVMSKIRYLMATKAVSFASDSFKICLMGSGFEPTPASQLLYSDISTYELVSGNGYSAGGQALSGVAVTELDANNKTAITWSNVSWTATGGSIGPSNGAFIYDTTVSNALVAFIDFGGNQTQVSGGSFTIAGLEVDV